MDRVTLLYQTVVECRVCLSVYLPGGGGGGSGEVQLFVNNP